MAIEITSITKIKDSIYTVTVRDTGDQTGVDEKGVAVYRTYSARYNVNEDASMLKKRIEYQIREQKALVSSEDTVESAVKTTVEAIDTSKLTAEG